MFCCTAGIGFIIYLIIYFTQPEDRCVFCSQQTIPYTGQEQNPPSSNLYGQSQSPSKTSPSPSEPVTNYCPNCGAKMDSDAKFCEICGTELNR